MSETSLQELLNMFPDFLDKSEISNFFKSQSVTNNQLQNIYYSLFDIVESLKLHKRCLIWKEQNVPYNYIINFAANYPNLKSVKCYKNDDLIYIEEYTYEENIKSFRYSYNCTNETNTSHEIILENEEEPIIIPEDTFKITLETYNELKITKGFPENDEPLGNLYDHDESLDELGALNNIPRKEYIPTEDYANTEPQYNNRLTEDDYHYMNRIIQYNLHLHDTPLPVLELWKLYGINASMVNRESYLFKMFDENMHEPGWEPQRWEHKDSLCELQQDLGKFLFVSANTTKPHKNKEIIFTFKFLNMYAEPLKTISTVCIKLNNEILEENWNNNIYSINASQLTENIPNKFTFIAKDDEGIFSTQELLISITDCEDADWYVSPTGNDTRDGKTPRTAFATIQKAANMVEGEENFIVVLGSTHTLTSPVEIKNNCTILGCDDAIIENTTNPKFFKVSQNKKLELDDVTLNYDTISSKVTSVEFTNNNISNQPIFVRISEDWEESNVEK